MSCEKKKNWIAVFKVKVTARLEMSMNVCADIF